MPQGSNQCQMVYDSQWQGQPVTISVYGQYQWQKALQPGQHVTLENLPAGEYNVALKVGNHTTYQTLQCTEGQNHNLNQLFSSRAHSNVVGQLFSGCTDVMFVGNKLVLNAYVKNGQFSLSQVPYGQYLVLQKKQDAVYVHSVVIEEGQEVIDLSTIDNVFVAEEKQALVTIADFLPQQLEAKAIQANICAAVTGKIYMPKSTKNVALYTLQQNVLKKVD